MVKCKGHVDTVKKNVFLFTGADLVGLSGLQEPQ